MGGQEDVEDAVVCCCSGKAYGGRVYVLGRACGGVRRLPPPPSPGEA